MTTITQIGHSRVEFKPSKSILTRSSGYIGTFDYTLNPYGGCTFGCTYCYAAFFARTETLKAEWGNWVQVKENALDLLKKRRRPLNGQTIYMSSVTDPYQPIEKELELTRAILEELAAYHQPRLVIQTRSPLVTRDIDVLTQFQHVQINMTVTTDDEAVRRVFEPTCPSNARRLEAVQRLHQAGLRTCITMTPLLPVRDPQQFAEAVLATGADKFVVQHFHASERRFVAGTGNAALDLFEERRWTAETYARVVMIMRQTLPDLWEGQAGFAPVWD
ncbi:MAG: radical SAM protein [Anaerolineae bacterium]|nr:radical SAM protein [Anaerolineae bacterium]